MPPIHTRIVEEGTEKAPEETPRDSSGEPSGGSPDYSIETCRKLAGMFHRAELHRPMRIGRYDEGAELEYEVCGVSGGNRARVRLIVDRFVGGGFAGQVYRVKATWIKPLDGPVRGLETGGLYAMKILTPPSAFARIFRNLLYWVGFQGPFQLQVNPAAARAGALWQKFFRRGARIRFGQEDAVTDIHATFVDTALGSCGELSEWIDGRTWRLEVDDRLDYLKQWRKGAPMAPTRLGSPEYRAKYDFMRRFVELLHEMGGHEFARQYEWSTCKSQPNCLKRSSTEDDPAAGLTAVDFRAGLALLPFLPMSPGDIKLILRGIARGSLVQFDRGSIPTLEGFIAAHPEQFADMAPMLEDLKESERIYRNSTPDLFRRPMRIFYSPGLWAGILKSTLGGWRVKNLVDDQGAHRLERSRGLTALFFWIAMIPVVGDAALRFFGHAGWRNHYKEILKNWGYVKRAVNGKIAETLITWHRAGRIDADRSLLAAASAGRFLVHLPLSVLPVGLHRFLTDRVYAADRLDHIFLRPIRLYFNADEREAWLREMVEAGREKQMLIKEDAEIILSRIKEPFVQKYLKSLAVHVCTMPVTQVVSVMVAAIYIAMNPDMPRAQAWGVGLGIIALFQVTPVSPGSLVRGLYVLYLVVKERNFKDYNIAVFLGFFKYIGYLAFPIQMAYRYPVLARFMAGHWANQSVHVVPVFGESGALLEHWVFRLFYNWPLTLRRRIQKRMLARAALKKRFWHVGLYAAAGAAVFLATDAIFLHVRGAAPGLKAIWYIAVLAPAICGAGVTLGCGGAFLRQRFVGSVACGAGAGVLYTLASSVFTPPPGMSPGDALSMGVWRVFVFSIFSVLGAIITEIRLPDPDLKKI